jgi:outer membrane protein assembly factor BamB
MNMKLFGYILRGFLIVILLSITVGLFWRVEVPSLAQMVEPTLSVEPSLIQNLKPGISSVAGNGQPDAIQANEWPQVQYDAERRGYIPETPDMNNFGVIWTKAFQPEKIYPQVQAIICNNRVLVGTEMGNLYALNATTGSQYWKTSLGTPILASVACNSASDLVFVGAMNGTVYGINLSNGGISWHQQMSTRLGFSTAPVIANSKVMLGGRNGVFYAFDYNGNLQWSYTVSSPILQTAAADNGRVFFGAMNMSVYALNTSNGSLAWKSEPLKGMALKDYWPMVYNNKIFLLVTGGQTLGVTDGTQVTDPVAQQAVLDEYDANPDNYEISLYTLSEDNGEELPAMIYYTYQTQDGAPSPPCVDRDGYLIIPAPRPTGGYPTGWGRLDTNQRIVTQALYDGTNNGYGNQDESFNLTCAGNIIFTFHTEEENAHYTGYFNLSTNTWTHISAGHTNLQMTTNTQGGGGNPASIANGIVYHISWYELIARSAR